MYGQVYWYGDREVHRLDDREVYIQSARDCIIIVLETRMAWE